MSAALTGPTAGARSGLVTAVTVVALCAIIANPPGATPPALGQPAWLEVVFVKPEINLMGVIGRRLDDVEDVVATTTRAEKQVIDGFGWQAVTRVTRTSKVVRG
jgi:hypothetical protein